MFSDLPDQITVHIKISVRPDRYVLIDAIKTVFGSKPNCAGSYVMRVFGVPLSRIASSDFKPSPKGVVSYRADKSSLATDPSRRRIRADTFFAYLEVAGLGEVREASIVLDLDAILADPEAAGKRYAVARYTVRKHVPVYALPEQTSFRFFGEEEGGK